MLDKKGFILILLVLITVLFHAHGVRNSTATVVGGRHDLSMWGDGSQWSGQTREVCVYCHTPHSANRNRVYTTNPNNTSDTGSGNTALNGQYLWNRALPANTFQVYTSDTYTFQGNPPQPGKFSLLCLSCHDGIGAMNVLINYPVDWDNSNPPLYNQFGDININDPNVGALNIGEAVCSGDDCTTGGTNLQNDHPVGFLYNDAQSQDNGLKPFADLPLEIQRRLNITGGYLECSSCHDPHRTNTGGNMFLVMDNNGSQLCLGCHIK